MREQSLPPCETRLTIEKFKSFIIILLTLSKSLLMVETPIEVLISIGHKLHKLTVIIEVKNDLDTMGSSETYSALTTIVTRGNQAKGETGLNTCTMGLNAEFNRLLNPIHIPKGMAIIAATINPAVTVNRLVNI